MCVSQMSVSLSPLLSLLSLSLSPPPPPAYYTGTSTQHGQKRASNPLEIVTGCWVLPGRYWEPNASPVEEQKFLLIHFSSCIYLVL